MSNPIRVSLLADGRSIGIVVKNDETIEELIARMCQKATIASPEGVRRRVFSAMHVVAWLFGRFRRVPCTPNTLF